MQCPKGKYDVVITVYNDEKHIVALLEEIELQTLLPEQVIITDGGSSDNTVAAIKEFAKRTKMSIQLFVGERLNIAQGFNKGIQNAKSKYIGIVACGNHYPNNFFESLAGDLDKLKAVQIVFASVRGDGKTEFSREYYNVFKDFYEIFPSNHGNLIRKELFQKYGYFCEEFSYAGEDTEYFYRVFSRGAKAYHNTDTYCIWEVPSGYAEYINQIKNYTIAFMETYENIGLLYRYKKKIVYIAAYITVFCCLLTSVKVIKFCGYIGLFLLAAFNIRLYRKRGRTYYFIKQIDYLYWPIILIKHISLFSKKNKISKPLGILRS